MSNDDDTSPAAQLRRGLGPPGEAHARNLKSIENLRRRQAQREVRDWREYREYSGLDDGDDPPVDGNGLDPEFSIMSLADVWKNAEPVKWIWNKRLPRKGLTLFAGIEGTGKTTVLLEVLARATNGALPGQNGEGEKVIYWGGEDDPAVTAGRLVHYGADMAMLRLLGPFEKGKRSFDPATDAQTLLKIVEKEPPGVIALDPVISLATGKNNNAEDVRRSVTPFVDRCADMGIAVVGNGHFTKDSGGRRLVQRFMGSGGWTQLARMVWVMLDLDGRLVFGSAKSSYGDRRGVYDIELSEASITYPNGEVGQVGVAVFGDIDTEQTIDEIEREAIAEFESDGKDEAKRKRLADELDLATAWFMDQGGHATSYGFDNFCKEQKWGERKRRDVVKLLSIGKTKHGEGMGQTWYRFLPGYKP